MKSKITLFAAMLFISAVTAQVTNQGEPLSWKIDNLSAIEPINMPDFDLAALQEEDSINDIKNDRPWRFGHEQLVDHNLDNSGTWQTLSNGDRIWRIRYFSKGAKTLNFLFTDFYMPEGASLYLYNNRKTDLLGAYDASQNNAERVLGTWLVQGDDVYIEYYEPAAMAGQGKLEIFKVVHGYRTVASNPTLVDPDDGINQSGDCNYDVECYVEGINSLKEISKKSVAIIIVNNSGFCSGSLINNTANNGVPYFLTADHCYSDPAQWAFMFNWINPNPVCAANQSSTNNTPNLTASGAQLRARREQSDFMLVELTSQLPSNWDLVWSGWDRTEAIPPLVYGVHHPSGDIMKVSVDYDAPTIVNDDSVFGYVWNIANWDMGGLEPGSSGSPMFDHNGRIRGQAWYIYGEPVCNGVNPGGQSSGYGRLSTSWQAGSTPATRLKEWLDPLNTGALSTNAYPPQVTYALDAEALFFNVSNACLDNIDPGVWLVNNGTQTITSAQINYTLNNGTEQAINWSGSIAQNQNAFIDLPVATTVTGTNSIAINIVTINGQADQNVSNNSVTATFGVYEPYAVSDISFTLKTDFFAEEIWWELSNQDGMLVYNSFGNIYENDEIYNEVFTLLEGCYTFSIFDEYGDGICCGEGEGYYILTINDTVIKQGGDYGSGESVTFKLQEPLGLQTQATENLNVIVHPNPSSGLFTIQVAAGYTPDYTVHNLLGQQVAAGTINTAGTINLSQNAAGVYILQLTNKATGAVAGYKLIKQ